MSSAHIDPFGIKQYLDTAADKYTIYSLPALADHLSIDISRLPFSIRILLESLLRNCDGFNVTQEDVINLARWNAANPAQKEIPFKPARVILQDFTGVPALVDLAAMRSAMKRLGGDPGIIEPIIPSDLVIDHSLQVDHFATSDALAQNMKIEFERNRERYQFLKWGQQAFHKFRVVPPGIGIIHQVNLEYLACGVHTSMENGESVAYPDSLVGTDSHTTMINGLGIVGWGVGGIEAEAVMLGQPIYMLMPEVIGVRVTGDLKPGATATDIALTATQILRKKGVVNKFVEFFGAGLSTMSLPDRATIANMAPEYGATIGFFPIDQESINYLRRTGRPSELVDLVEQYMKKQALFRFDSQSDPVFTDIVELELDKIEPSLAGPKRPQDRVTLNNVKDSFTKSLSAPIEQRGYNLPDEKLNNKAAIKIDSKEYEMNHGAVVIAAITSCTNTSNASVMLAAGLLAKKAVEKGLSVPSYVKTSLAPGSRVVTSYLESVGLMLYLEKLGFNVVGYGCTTCIGNSGPLPDPISSAISSSDLVAAAVLSGNRNFEGRVNPHTRANYLASPPLVVAYALAGKINVDLTTEPLGSDMDGKPVYLKDIWPTTEEILALQAKAEEPSQYRYIYTNIDNLVEAWNNIEGQSGSLYEWQDDSSYIQEPPFFENMNNNSAVIAPILSSRVLALFGDSVTTDHISPAGSIAAASPAGRFLISSGIPPADFNSYGARRGNDRVMVRGTFANIRLKNLLLPGIEGGVTRHFPGGDKMSIYDAAMQYKQENVPLIIIAGKEYGTGSSRDWAAKGTMMLGVRAVIAESFERIHRSNLVGMGILPLQFKNGESAKTLNLDGTEKYSIIIDDTLKPRQDTTVVAEKEDGSKTVFITTVRIDTPVEIKYYRHGGILPTVLKEIMTSQNQK
jgi:aconitate hydratase